MKSILINSFWVMTLLLSCGPKKNKTDTLTISGITYRDVSAVPGSQDLDDWTSDAVWPDFISSKFNFVDTIDYSTGGDTSTLTLLGYPNPANTAITLNCQSSNATILKYIVVDQSVTVYSKDTYQIYPGYNSIQLSLSNTMYPANRLYRVYYAFYDKNKHCYFKGHGDIKKI
ncbi:hypothetical protein EMGBS15_13470 [Filimonas sp.]|nr:hypothetical protein EMGBS15_13470 [Filimonas sp.]